jgi:hypothetical protein
LLTRGVGHSSDSTELKDEVGLAGVDSLGVVEGVVGVLSDWIS